MSYQYFFLIRLGRFHEIAIENVPTCFKSIFPIVSLWKLYLATSEKPLFKIFILVYSIAVVAVFPLCPPPPIPSPLPQSILTPLSISTHQSYMFFDYSLPLLPISPPPAPPFLCRCQSVPCFHVSASVLLISLFSNELNL